jgi:hypothetical protein
MGSIHGDAELRKLFDQHFDNYRLAIEPLGFADKVSKHSLLTNFVEKFSQGQVLVEYQ